jgi:ubiquinone/menaquinone biosynthesis C-methylase UbiE
MLDVQQSGVVHFYDTHPINEEEILAKLRARGVDPDSMNQEALKDLDQDHYGGTGAVEALAALAGIGPGHRVLDVCSGMGGPARWLAHRIGCRVTGLDLTASRVESARRLTRRVGLDHLVDFVQGDATAMPLPDASFDAVIGQEAWVHVPDKGALFAQCARVLRTGATVAFTDIVSRVPLSAREQEELGRGMLYAEVGPIARHVELLEANGFRVESVEDLSEQWAAILRDRLEMYRSLRDTTVAKFGQAHYEAWDSAYGFFVGLYQTGRMGGARVLARRH